MILDTFTFLCLFSFPYPYTGKKKIVAVVQWLSPVQLFATPWTVAGQAPLFVGFSREDYWSGLPCPSPGDLPDPGMEPGSPALAGKFFTV